MALILKDNGIVTGIMAFHETAGSIDFLGVHPQYRKKGIAKAFCEKALYELACAEAELLTMGRLCFFFIGTRTGIITRDHRI